MARTSLAERWKYLLVEPHFPNIGIEINSDCIRLVVIQEEKGNISIQHFDSEDLPAGVVEVNPFKPNIHQLEVVADALKAIWSRNRFKSSKVCLLLQDRCALTFQISLEHPASNRRECLDLVRFKLKKSVPFRIEEALVSYFDSSGGTAYNTTAVWATVMNQSVLQQYEQIVESSIDSQCGLVDLTTYNLLNLGHAEIKSQGYQDEDFLYVNLNREYISIAITQQGKLTFFRSRALERVNGVIEEALTEIHPTAMFYVDKLGGTSFSQAFVYSVENPEELTSRIEKDFQLKSSILTLESITKPQLDPSSRRYVRTFAPLLGLILSRRVEFL